jgi:hypothetical protein
MLVGGDQQWVTTGHRLAAPGRGASMCGWLRVPWGSLRNRGGQGYQHRRKRPGSRRRKSWQARREGIRLGPVASSPAGK